jgi:hypothetical protein
VTPTQPSPEILAVIVAAYESSFHQTESAEVGAGDPPAGPPGPEYVWRFSGRWWNKPVLLRRDRPWT